MTTGGLWQHALHASWAVKWVMVVLLGLSIASWAMMVEHYRYLKRVDSALDALKKRCSVDSVLHATLGEWGDVAAFRPIERILQVGQARYRRSRMLPEEQVEAQCRLAMQIPQTEWEQGLHRHLSRLASIASISPYIGLLGTVCGIMLAFQALADAPQANMMVVAPGIAEALVTTALGLVVAIPASIGYNQLNEQALILSERMNALIDQFIVMVHDELLGPGEDDAS